MQTLDQPRHQQRPQLQLDPQGAIVEVLCLSDLLSEVAATHKHALDVGAHRGMITRALVGLGFDVLAVEANPPIAEQFEQRQAELLQAGRVRLVRCAASDHNGTAELFVGSASTVSSLEPEWTTKGFPEEFRNKRSVSVPARRLDDLVREQGVQQVGFLKVDVEGHEPAVLRGYFGGGAGTVPMPAVVMFEAFERFPAEARQCLEYLAEQGYRQFDIFIRVGADLVEVERFTEPVLPKSWRPGTLFYANIVAYSPHLCAKVTLPRPDEFMAIYQRAKADGR